jgi:hypothetical protein
MQQWDLLIRLGRSADMLARLADSCAALELLEQIPSAPRVHLESAAILARRQHRELRWEVQLIEEALAPERVPVVLLKGAAYAMAGLMASRGRMMSDVDILVPRDQLEAVEFALMKRGWVSTAQSAYDQRYYRKWMHELPPMQHVHRGTVIDVHHAILPLTARSHPASGSLLSSAQALQAGGRILVLAPVDMLLHSATHLFHEGELEQGFRGLVDIDNLLQEFGSTNAFWQDLVPRAVALELVGPLFYALRYVNKIMGTKVPVDVTTAIASAPGATSSSIVLAFMDLLFLRALLPDHATASDRWTPLARWLLYLRGHWLRMPPSLLIVHLVRKLFAPRQTSANELPKDPR